MGRVNGSGPDGLPAGNSLPPIEASDGSLVVPDAQLLFTADYTRVGDDLLLTGTDGTTLVIANYFALDAAPILFSPDGAMMAPQLVATLVASQTPRLFAQTGEIDTEPPIGQIQDVVGTAAIIRDGVPVELLIGDPVFRNDVVQTGLASDLTIGFADGTIFTLAANARITLDGMIYDPAGTDNSLVLSIVQGTFSFITGQIAPTGEMLIKTPVATIGIRGTEGYGTLESALGPLSFTASATGGGPPIGLTYSDPVTGDLIANISTEGDVYVISRPGAQLDVRPQTAQEQIETQAQSDKNFNAQVNNQIDFNVQPIDQPATDSNQSGDAEDAGDPDAPQQADAGAQDGDGAPLETAAGAGTIQPGGGIGFDRQDTGEVENLNPTISGSDTQITPTTSPPPSSSDGSGPEITQDDPPPPANTSPAAAADTVVTAEDTAVVVPVLVNDSDPDGDALSVSAVTQGTNGGVAINADGTVTYTPNANFNGADSFTYTVSDGNGGTDTATVSVTVNPVNDAPNDFDIAATASFENLAAAGLSFANGIGFGSRNFTDTDTGFDGAEGSPGPLPNSLPVVDTNGTLATAQDIPRAAFGIVSDPNLGDDSLPSVRIDGLINTFNDVDFYRIELQAGETVTLDIDFGEGAGADTVDTQVFLLDGAGNVLAGNDDSPITNGGDGSVDRHDSFLQFTAPAGGVFFVGVTAFSNDIQDGGARSGGGDDTGDYILNISVEPTPTSTGLSGTASASTGGSSAGGAIFVTGHDSEEHGNTDYMNAGLDFLAFGHQASGGEIAQRGSIKVAFLNPNNDTFALNAILAGGWDATFFDLDSDFSAAFDGTFDLIMVGSGDGNLNHRDALFNSASNFEAFINGGGGLYINTDEGLGQTWYDFVPSFGTAQNNNIGAAGIFTPTAAGNDIGLTEAVVDRDITHSFYTGVDTNLFTVFELTQANTSGVPVGLPVAFGTRNIGVSGGEFINVAVNAGFLYEFQVGEAGIVVDNIHGTDLEDGVTAQFTITGLPRNAAGEVTGQLLIDRGGDGVIDDILSAAELGTAAANVQSGDSVFYFLSEDSFQATPGSVAFTYLTLDSGGLPSDGATATVSFGNAPPRADSATLTFDQDSQDNPLGLSAPSDPDGDALTITVVTLPDAAQGAVTLADGTAVTVGQALSPAELTGLQYDAILNASGAAGQFVYSVFDGTATVQGTVDFDIVPPNDPPVARDDAVTTDEDTALIGGNVLADNGSGADSDPEGDPLSVSAVNGNAADVGQQVTLASGALLTLNADGTFSYDPNGQFETLPTGQSATDSFDYTIADGNGGFDTATATVTVNGVNDAPVVDSRTVSVTEDSQDNALGLTAPSDAEGDPLAIAVVSLPNLGSVTLANGLGLETGQQISIAELLGLQYDTPVNANGPAGQFAYSVFDGTVTVQGTVDLDIAPVNDPPVLGNNTLTLNEGETVVLSGANLSATDADNADSALIFTVAGVAGGQFELVANPGVAIAQFTQAQVTAGVVQFAHDGGEAAPSYTVTVSDGTNTTAPDAAVIAFTNVNDAPIARPDAVTTDEDTALIGGNVLLDNGSGPDSDPEDDPLTVTAINGVAADVGNQTMLASGALLTLNADGTFSYDPNGRFETLGLGQSATDSFTYTITDSNGGFDTATATVTVNGVNDPPVARPDAVTTDEDTALIGGNVLADNGSGADSDPEGDPLSVSAVNGNAADVGSQVTLASGALLTLNADGTFSYDPNGQFETLPAGQSASDSFDYTIADGNGGFDTATATVTVNGVNDAPVVDSRTVSVTEDSQDNALGLAAPSDVDGDALTITVVSLPDAAQGAVTLADGTAVTVGQVLSPAELTGLQYDAILNASGAAGQFVYSVFDGTATVQGTVDLDIVPQNDPPVARPDAVTTDEDTALIGGNVLLDNGNGADSDPEGDPLSVSAVNGNAADVGNQVTLASGALLTLNADGTFSYDPNGQFETLPAGQSASDSFDYTIADANGGFDTATATVTVNGVNDAPVVDSRTVSVTEDSQDNALGLTAPSDAEGDPLAIAVVSLPNLGSVTLANGLGLETGQQISIAELLGLQYDTPVNANGPAGQFAYSVFDGTVTVQGTVDLDIAPVNDAPVARDDALTTGEDTVLAGSVLTNNGNGADSDPEGDPLTVTAINGVAVDVGNQISLAGGGLLLRTFDDPTVTTNDDFGGAVALDGNNVLIGAFLDDTKGSDVGQVHLFDATTGTLRQTFDDPTITGGDRFGNSVAIEGNFVLVGAPRDDTQGPAVGQAHLFNATTGALLQTFDDPTVTNFDEFGISVAISGNRVLIGASADDTVGNNVGQAHLFDTGGTLLQTFNDPTPTGNDSFGFSVALDGNLVLIGARGDDTQGPGIGQAHLFNTDGTLLRTFDDPTPTGSDIFGTSVALDGNRALIGARGDDTQGANVGQAYLFDVTTGALLQTFDDPTPTGGDFFGVSVALQGNRVLIGASEDDTQGSSVGQAYLFDATTGALLETFDDPTVTSRDRFGTFVALDGGAVLIGAPVDDTSGLNVGQAHLFDTAAGGLLQLNADGTFSYDPNGAFDFLAAGETATDSFDYTISDGNGGTDTATATVTIAGVNDAPVINLNGADGAAFTEQDIAAVTVDADLTLADPDSAQLTGATVTIGNLGNPGQEILAAATSGTGIAAGFDAATGVLTLSGTATLAQYEQVLRTVTYRNDADDPTLGGSRSQRTIRYVVNDGIAASAAAIAAVDLSALNDAPLNTVPGAQSKPVATDLVLNALSIADADAGGNDVQVTLSVVNGVLTLVSTGGLAFVTGDGTADATMTFTGTLAAINAALAAGVTYSSNAGFAGTDTLTIVTDDLGNTGSPGALSDTDSIAITVSDQTGDVILQGLSLTVGDTGTGTFSLSNGDSLLLGTAIVGNTASGIGTLDVTGAGTALNVTAATSLIVGAAGTGTLNINSGATTTVGTPGSAAFMTIGDQATGVGTVTVNNATLTVDGSGGLAVGNLGTGTLRIENGALAEVTSNDFNTVEIGLGDGGTGTVVVTGANSTLSTLGDKNTVKLAQGVGSTASLTVEAGGTVSTTQLEVGFHGLGTATIDGGTIDVTTDNGRFNIPGFENEAAFVRIGRFSDGVGVVNVINGGLLQVRPDTAGETSGPGVALGKFQGSSGSIFVDGLGSRFDVVQTNQELEVGNGGNAQGAFLSVGAESGQGQLEVTNQGSASVTGFSIFRFSVAQNADSSGSVLIDGAGSGLTLLANNAKPVVAGLTFADPSVTIGNRGAGDMTVANGGTFSASAVGAIDFTIAAASGSTGTLNVQTGAQAIVSGDGTEVVVGDDGDGFLNVSGGGTFAVDGLGGVFPGLIIGGTDTSAGTGTGTVTVTGTGSSLALAGDTPFIEVGNLGTGILNVEDGGAITGATFMLIGRQPGGVGTLNLSGDTSSIVMSGKASLAAAAASATTTEGQGAFLSVGPQGTGTLNITAGADFLISVTDILGDFLGAGFNIGGGAGGGGTGTINVDGVGSTLRVAASHIFAAVGRDNVGDLIVANGGSVELAGTTQTVFVVGDDPGAVGTATIRDAGMLSASGESVFVDIGREAGSMGTLDILSGGQVALTGGNTFTQFRIGRNLGSEGIVHVEGAGSKLTVTGTNDPSANFRHRISVGDDGTGTLETRDGGIVESLRLDIGRLINGVGTALVDNANWNIGINGLNVGVEGDGTLTISNGGLVAVDSATNIASAGGSTGAVTLRGPGSQFNVNGDLTVGNGFVNPNGGFGTNGVPTSGTLELFGGGTASVANNLIVARNDTDVTGTLLVSGVSVLDVTNTVNIGAGLGAGSLTIQNGLVPDELVLSTAPVNLRASAIAIGANGTLNLGKGSIDLPGGTLANDGVINLGQGPGLHFINGNYSQGAAGVLNLRLGAGGNGTAVFGTANFGAAPTVNLNRIGGAGGARFGDAMTLAVVALGAGSVFDINSVNVNQPTLGDGLDVFRQDVSFDGLPEAIQFTTVTTQTVEVSTGITGGLNRTDTDELITGDVTDSDISVSSTAGNQSLLAINGDVVKNIQVQRGINVSAEGNTVLALNGSAEADFINVGQGGGGTATLLIGSVADVFNLSSVIVGDQGTGLSELFVHGDLSTTNLTIGNAVGSNGRVTVAGGLLNVTGLNTLTVGQEGTGELIVSDGGVVNDAGSLLFAVAAGSTGTVTVMDDGSQLSVAGNVDIAKGFFQTGFGQLGAATSGDLNVLGGGSVNIGGFVNIAQGADTTGTVNITGGGSQLIVDNTISLANAAAATGALNVLNSGVVESSGVNIATRAGATGTVNVAGAGSRLVSATPADQFAQIVVGANFDNSGTGGTGTLNIGAGGEVRFQRISIGTAAGSTGAVNVSGAGARLVTFGEQVGGDTDTIRFGAGDGTLTVSNSGFLNTAVLSVTGTGVNRLIVKDPGTVVRVDNTEGIAFGDVREGGFLRAGRNDGETGEIDVSGGAKVFVSSGPTQNFGPGLQIARNDGSTGKVTIDGAGAAPGETFIEISTPNLVGNSGGFGPYFNLRTGAGTLDIINGGELRLIGDDAFAQIGRGNAELTNPRPSDGNIPAQAALSTATVNTGGKLFVDSGANPNSAGINVGQEANANGAIILDGTNDPADARSEILLSGGAAGQQAAFFSVGLDGTGAVDVLAAARILIDGLNGTFPGMQIGGSSNRAGGTGAVTVKGAGSEIEILGDTGVLNVGTNGIGTLNVEEGGSISGVTFVTIGRLTGSDGTTIVDGSLDPVGFRSQILLSGVAGAAAAANSPDVLENQAAFLSVGLGGTGRLEITGGARISIDGLTGDHVGVQAGRNAGSDGTIVVDGAGSSLMLQGALTGVTPAIIAIGRSGTGDLQIVNGGTVTNTANGVTLIGVGGTIVSGTVPTGGLPGEGAGSVLVQGTATNISTLNAGAQLLVGMGFDFDANIPLGPNTGGSGTLTIGNFGQVNASQVFIGTDGRVEGTGSLSATTTMLDGGDIAAGFSAGTLNIGGDLTAISGALEVELGGTGAGASDLIQVSGAADLQGAQVEFSLIGGYLPQAGDQIVILSAAGGASLDPSRLSLAIAGVAQSLDFSVDLVGNDLIFTANATAVAGNRAFFLGSALDDTYAGGLGDDVIDGGAGVDTAVFAGSVIEFSISTDASGTTTVTDTNGADGDQGSDTLTNVEALSFDDFTGTFAEIAATIFGTLGDDILTGTAGGDVIFGLAGNDTLTGGLGDDTLDGGTGGADRAVFAGNAIDFSVSSDASGATVVTDINTGDGDQGTDTLSNVEVLVFDDFTVTVGQALAPITGTAGNDALSGTSGADLIFALAGDDTIVGSAGADAIDGGAGVDTVDYSGGGRVTVDLSQGFASERLGFISTFETLDPTTGNITNVINPATRFFDALAVSPVTGTLYTSGGGSSGEIFAVDPATGASRLLGNAGVGGISDLEFRSDGASGFELFGVTGRRTGSQLVKIDLDETTPGNPVLGPSSFAVGLTGVPDGLSGVAIDDTSGTVFASSVTSRDPTVSFLMTIDPASGAGTVIAPITDSVTGEQLVIGDLAIQPGSGVLYGVIGGSNGFSTNPNHDLAKLYSIDVATGVATLAGEIFNGDEIRILSSGIAFAADGTLYHYGFLANLEIDTLSSIENVIGSNGANQSSGTDQVIGNDGDNVFDGLRGNDRFTGGLGNDTFNGGSGNDRADFGGNVGDFTVTTVSGVTTVVDQNLADGNLGTDTLTQVETLVFDDFVGSAAEVEAGIFGTAGDDAALSGTVGGDLIFGLAGNDTISGGDGNDDLRGGGGDDTLSGGGSTDSLSGGFGDDTLLGGLGDDTLTGGFGNDVLRGGAQADTLTGGPGADIFVFSPGDGGTAISLADVITDFVDGADLIGLSGGLVFADLTIAGDGFGSSIISVPATAEFLVTVDGIIPSLLDETDFTVVV